MITALSLSPLSLMFSQDAPQAHSHPAIHRAHYIPVAVFEVFEPTPLRKAWALTPPYNQDKLPFGDNKMQNQDSNATMAVFLDLENIALGVHDAHYPTFNIQKVLERLLLKGHIVVKKAYCDFDRFKAFKRDLHEAAFELIEIPHLRHSGKNSADIRMVVDALDLCYTKGHVDTFVILSGDSDFSPLVSKLKENDKTVIGVGVKNSTSDLFLNNCDEFLYYDDMVRSLRAHTIRSTTSASAAPTVKPVDTANKGPSLEKAFDMVLETLEALTEERGENEPIWASMIKQAIKRRHPGFNERAHGFRSFNDLLLEAQKRNLLRLEPDQKSGGYTVFTIDSHPDQGPSAGNKASTITAPF